MSLNEDSFLLLVSFCCLACGSKFEVLKPCGGRTALGYSVLPRGRAPDCGDKTFSKERDSFRCSDPSHYFHLPYHTLKQSLFLLLIEATMRSSISASSLQLQTGLVIGAGTMASLWLLTKFRSYKQSPFLIPTKLLESPYRKELHLAVKLALKGEDN